MDEEAKQNSAKTLLHLKILYSQAKALKKIGKFELGLTLLEKTTEETHPMFHPPKVSIEDCRKALRNHNIDYKCVGTVIVKKELLELDVYDRKVLNLSGFHEAFTCHKKGHTALVDEYPMSHFWIFKKAKLHDLANQWHKVQADLEHFANRMVRNMRSFWKDPPIVQEMLSPIFVDTYSNLLDSHALSLGQSASPLAKLFVQALIFTGQIALIKRLFSN